MSNAELIARARTMALPDQHGYRHTTISKILIELADALAATDKRLYEIALDIAHIETVLMHYASDGHLQTFEDRERFRKAARAAIALAEKKS